MRMWRSHPVLLMFAAGAAVGLAVACTLTVLAHHIQLSEGLLLSLLPTSLLGLGLVGATGTSLLLGEVFLVGCNAILYGCVFAAVSGLVVVIRRSSEVPEEPTSIGKV